MKADDQFHVGIVVDDFERALTELNTLFGYEWCDEIALPVTVRLPEVEQVVNLRFSYTRNIPRMEIVETVPGTVWEPAAGSRIHHIGYWSEDVDADSAALVRHGLTREASGVQPDGTPYWAYHRSANGPRIELVSRAIQPMLEQYWVSGSDRSTH